MTAPRPRLWERRFAVGIVVAAVLAIYAPTLVFTSVAYDDEWLWADDSPLRAPTPAVWHDVFFELQHRHALGSEYLPVRDASVALDMALWGEHEHGPHLTQLLIVVLTTIALGFLLIRLGVPRPIAWVGTLVWTVHPLHVESVAWVSERKGVLAGLFVMLLGHCWLRYRDRRSRWWVVAGVLAAIAATWSKAPAMFAPAAFGAIDLLLLPAARRRWIAIGAIGGATALAAIPVILVARHVGVVAVSAGGADVGRFATAIGVHGHYVAGLVLARSTSLSYPISTDGPSGQDLALGVASIAALLVTASWLWRRRRTRPAARWGLALIAWAAIWFLPISHLIAPIHITVADRYVYLWMLAPCLAVVWGLEQLPALARTASTAVLVLGLGVVTIRSEEAWTSSLQLFRRAVAANPNDTQAVENLAIAAFSLGHQKLAIQVLDDGLAHHPGAPYLLARKSSYLEFMGQRAAALEAARQAAESGMGSTLNSYAALLAIDHQYAAALPFAQRAVARHPEIEVYARLEAEILIALGRLTEAQQLLRVAIAMVPNASPDHMMMAKILIQQARYPAARAELDLAARDVMLATEVTALRRLIDGLQTRVADPAP